MAQRRVVHKLEAPPIVTFDDQLWPINIALLVLGGFVAGTMIALIPHDSPWLWIALGTLCLSVGLLIWIATGLGNHVVRRGLQLAALLSVIVHLLLIVALYNQRIRNMLAQSDAPPLDELVEEAIPVEIEYYVQSPQEAQRPDFERPTEVDAADEPTAQLQRQQPQTVPTTRDNPTATVPQATASVQPNAVPLSQTEQAIPRRSDTPSQLSRQVASSATQPVEPVESPRIQSQQEPAVARVEAQSTPVQQRSTLSPARQQTEDSQPQPQQQAVQIARRDNDQTPELASSTPTMTRAVREPQALVRTDAEAPADVPISQSSEPTIAPQPSTALARQRTAGPEVAMQQSAEQRAATSVSPNRLQATRQPLADQPRVAQSSAVSAQRAAQEASLPVTAAADAPQLASRDSAATPSALSPAPTEVARSNTTAPADSAQASGASDAASTQPSAVAAAAMDRRTDAARPTVNPQGAPSAQFARSPRVAASEASPIAIDSPSSAASGSAQTQPSLQPSSTSLARGTTGIAGAGNSPNFDRGESGAVQPATQASVAANRPQASQTGPQGPAAAPSQPARIARSIAGANVPSSVLSADQVELSEAAGSPRLASIDASSSAALEKADASAPQGAVTAAAGTGPIDLGPTQIVASVGSGRPSGGGGPTVQISGSSAQRSRSPASAPASSLAAQTVADLPAAPAGDGGGAPAAGGAINPTSAAAQRGSSAEGPAASAARVAAVEPGTPTAPVTAGPISRAATAGEGQPGPTLAGSTPQPSRRTGEAFAADTRADADQLPSGPQPSDAPSGAAAQLAGTETIRSAAGLPGRALPQDAGAAEGPLVNSSAVVGSPGAGLNPRRDAASGGEGPTVAAVAGSGPTRKVSVAGVPVGVAADIAEPSAGSPSTGEVASEDLRPGAPTGSIGRRSGSLPVEVAAASGPGGLGAEVSRDVGSISRRAQRDSVVVHAGVTRYMGRKVGGPVAIDGHAREAAEAFATRDGQRLGKGGGPGQPAHRTEISVELGLDFLAREQSPDGSWSLTAQTLTPQQLEREQPIVQSDTAATGLALLAFLGAGYDHFDEKYSRQITAGLDWLIKNQAASGDLYVEMDAESAKSAKLYSHGIAAIALCEAYGMTGDDTLREPAQKAIDYIIATQNPQLGGWRYEPRLESDTSVSGWQLMALKSGELAGLKVPREPYQKVASWLTKAQASAKQPSQYVYNPYAPDTTERRAGRKPSQTMTAVGLLMRMYLGWNRDDRRMVEGADYLLDHLPTIGVRRGENQVDTYYWYYATQVMFHMKGDYWKKWNDRLHPMLVDRQVKEGDLAGSWDPHGDKWGDKAGRIYVTTLNLLSLEVYYRHLPIYESTAK